MDKFIRMLFDLYCETAPEEPREGLFDPARIKELTMKKINTNASDARTKTKRKKVRTTGRAVLLAAVLGTLLIGTALALSCPDWSAGLREHLGLSPAQTEALEGSELIRYPGVLDSRNGVTVSLAQAAADENSAFIALKITGLNYEEGTELRLEDVSVTLNGEPAPNVSRGFYAGGLTWDGQQYVYADGSPAELSEEGLPLPRYADGEGALEYDIFLSPGQGGGESLLGQTVEIRIGSIAAQPLSLEYSPDAAVLARGPWVLTWTAEGSVDSRTWELNESLCHGIMLKSIRLAPLSVHIEYEYPPLTLDGDRAFAPDGWELPAEEAVCLYQIRMKDGTVYTGILGGGVTQADADDPEKGFVYTVDMSLTRLIDPEAVAALVFQEAGTGEAAPGERACYTVTLE